MSDAAQQVSKTAQKFNTVVQVGPKGRVFLPLPFVPNDVWGVKGDHHVAGTINSMPVRAVVESLGDGYGIVVGPAWRRDCGVSPGDKVVVILAPEGPQRDDLAPCQLVGVWQPQVESGAPQRGS